MLGLLLLLFTLIKTQTILNNCLLFGNSQLLYQVHENKTFLYVSSANSFFGYGGVIFSNNKGENSTYLSYMNENELVTLHYENNEYKGTVQTFPNGILKKKVFFEKEYLYNFISKFFVSSIVEFTIKISPEDFKKYNETRIISNFSVKPNSTLNYEFVPYDYLSNGKNYEVKNNEIYFSNNVCYVTAMFSIFQIYYPFVFLNMLICIVALISVFILTVCRRNPMKSRGIFPLLSALFYFFSTFELLWSLFLDQEILGYFRCFLLNFLYHPIFSGITSLIFIRSLRFLIYNWLHNNKGVLGRKRRVYKIIAIFFKIISKWYISNS
jgi:hypothetical protein